MHALAGRPRLEAEAVGFHCHPAPGNRRSTREDIRRLSDAEPPYVTAQVVSLHVLEKTTS